MGNEISYRIKRLPPGNHFFKWFCRTVAEEFKYMYLFIHFIIGVPKRIFLMIF